MTSLSFWHVVTIRKVEGFLLLCFSMDLVKIWCLGELSALNFKFEFKNLISTQISKGKTTFIFSPIANYSLINVLPWQQRMTLPKVKRWHNGVKNHKVSSWSVKSFLRYSGKPPPPPPSPNRVIVPLWGQQKWFFQKVWSMANKTEKNFQIRICRLLAIHF